MKKLFALLFITAALFAQEAILSLEWFPSVCQVKHYKECRNPLPTWLDNLTLHGLWPQNRAYCHIEPRIKILDKRGDWQKIPLHLSKKLQQLLYLYMPGTLSGLHKHEWVKHGSCYGPPNRYFFDALGLLMQVNDSRVREFFIKHRGKLVQTYRIRKAFDRSFGKGTGKRVRIICKKGYITELRLYLDGHISAQTPLAQLLHKAKPSKIGCTIGKIAR